MNKAYLLLACIITVFTSCSSDSESNSALLIKQINTIAVDGDTFSTKYFYDGNKLSYFTTEEGNLKTEFVYIGPNDDLIGVAKRYDGDVLTSQTIYFYDSNERLFKEIYNDNINDIQDTRIYTYNADNTITRECYNGPELPSQLYLTSKIYLDDNAQFIKLADWDGTNWITKIEATYTSYNSPFKNIIGFDKLFTFLDVKHGFATFVQSNSIPGFNNASVFEYTLNGSNYPSQRVQTLTYENSSTAVTTSNFIYY